MSAELLSWFGDFLGQLFNFALPFGITFGAIVVGFVGMPLLVGVLKKLF